MQNPYPNLPGILTEFKDGGLQLRSDPNPSQTESILLLGTAIDGPVGVPVAVDSTTFETVFGKVTNNLGVYNGATLGVGFEEAWNGGCRDIRCMRISGTPATCSVKCDPLVERTEVLKSESIGVAPGNKETDFELQHEPVEASVIVRCDHIKILLETQYTVNVAEKTVTILENVCNSGAEVSIEYQYEDNEEQLVSVNENGDGIWRAAGEDVEFELSEELIVADTLVVLCGDEPLPEAAVGITGNRVILHPNYAPLGSNLIARYIAIEEADIEDMSIEGTVIYGGQLYNSSQYAVEDIVLNGQSIGRRLIIEKPVSKRTMVNEPPLTYSSTDYPTLGLLVRAINNDPRNGLFRFFVNKKYEDETSVVLKVTDGPSKFQYGSDGINLSKRKLFELLGGKRDANGAVITPGAYQLLENYTVDWIVPLGVYKDDELPNPKHNFAQQLAMACAVISLRQNTTYGVIPTKSSDDISLADISNHVDRLLVDKNDFYILDSNGDEILDSEGKKFDIGQYVHVVAGPDVMLRNTRFGTYYSNSAVIFAAMMTTRKPGSSPLNKAVPGVLGLRYTYGNSQRNSLTGARYVTYKTKQNGQVIAVEDAMTCAQPGSDYTRTTTVRAVKTAVDAVRRVCEPYLGEANSIPNRNAMSSAIDKVLGTMQEVGDLTGYRFNILTTLADQILGKAKVELTLIPPFELRQITIVVGLSPQ